LLTVTFCRRLEEERRRREKPRKIESDTQFEQHTHRERRGSFGKGDCQQVSRENQKRKNLYKFIKVEKVLRAFYLNFIHHHGLY
jgi:hypothetical protein